MSEFKQLVLGRYIIGLTLDFDTKEFPIGLQIGALELAFSLRSSVNDFIKLKKRVEHQLANDLSLEVSVSMTDGGGLVTAECKMARSEAQVLIKVIGALLDRYILKVKATNA